MELAGVTELLSEWLTVVVILYLWKQSTDQHTKAVEYYRQRLQQVDIFLQRLLEIWSGEQIDQNRQDKG